MGYQFSWFHGISKPCNFVSKEKKINHSFVSRSCLIHEFKNLKTDDFPLNHKNWHPQLKVFSK